ncbi:phage tail tape measure protein [Acinetobacter indicus]|uniref:phage tail tape measure protein n=1 Tax=Acinetobacter indicus TaxID=756892 RepID=UPI000AB18191|nr:phage tail tape measure protein [Acinetobacter indicus]
MTAQQSRLEIVIDTSKAKKGADDVTKSLKDVETQGDKTEKSVKDTAKVISDAGNTSTTSAKKVDDLSKSLVNAGTQAKTTSGKMSELRNTLAQAANDGKFGSQIQSVTGKLSEFRGGALLVGAAVTGALVGGVVAATGYLAGLAIEVAKNNVELSRFAAIANTTIENFQGLSGAAQTFGVSQEKTSDMLKDFNEKIGEFNAIGAGGAVDFFEQIAVKTEDGAEGAKKLAEEMSKMDGIDALQTYVDKLEEAGVNQKEMSFYLESMGSDLTALAPLLVDGGKLWKDYQAAMEEAGILTGQKAVEQSIELAAQTESVQMRFTALKRELASAVMPVLSQVIGYFLEGAGKGGQFAGVLDAVGVAAKGVGVIIIGLATGLQNLVTIISGALNQLKIIGQTAVNFATADGIMAKGKALWGGVSGSYQNAVSTTSKVIENSVNGFKSMGNIITGTSGKYDALTQSIINNRKAQLEWNKTQKAGRGGGAEQNKNLFPTAKAPKSNKAETNKALNEAKRLAEQKKREAERLQAEIERAKESVIREYATREERLLIDYNKSKEEIEKGFVNDPTNRELYLRKAKEAYDRDVEAYRAAQKEKLDSFKRDFADRIKSSQVNLELMSVAARYGRDSLIYRSRELTAQKDENVRGANTKLGDSISRIQDEYNSPEKEKERQELIEQAYKAHKLRLQEIDAQHNEATSALIKQQHLMQLESFSSLSGALMGLVGESSSAYAALFAIQKSLNLAQAVMNGYTAISAAWASAPFPYNMGAVTMATVQSGVLQAAIQAMTPGFANGGYTGHGGKYDPAGIVHKGEGVLTQEEVKALGGPQGFEDLRKSIRRGYSAGGLVADTHRVGMGAMNAINNGGSIQAEKQAQANAKVQAANPQPIENKVQVGIFDDRSDMLDQMRGREGEKIVMYHLRRNGIVRA